MATLALLSALPASAAEFTSQYFRWRATKLRNSTNELQISELRFKRGETLVPIAPGSATLTAAGGLVQTGEEVTKLQDSNTNTKWFTRYTVATTPSTVVIAFTAPVTLDRYTFATANDFDARDPVSWILETGTSATGPWTTVDVKTDYPTTINRFTYLPDFIIPAELPPEILSFDASPSVVTNGSPATLNWLVNYTTNFTVNPQPGAVNGQVSTSVSPPANADTEYTLIATNSAGTLTSKRTVRTVAGGPSTYRYVRFTPVKVRSTVGGTAIQIAEMTFASGATPITPAAVRTSTGLYTEVAATGPNKMRDALPATKWVNTTLQPVIFDLGSSVSFDRYGMVTANDLPDRDPVRWLVEGADDDTAGTSWTRIDDLTLFDYSTPSTRGGSFTVPLPGGSLPPLATLTGDAIKVIAGEPLTLSWTTTDAAGITITPNIGPVSDTDSITIFPTVTATYTLTATSPAGFQTVRTFPVTVVNSAVNEIAYESFDEENGELSLVGFAAILNDFANIPLPGNTERLRLTPDVTGRNGAAWFGKRVQVDQGFDTTFSFHFNKPTNTAIGADGMSFVVQDHALGNGALPDEKGLPNRSLAIQIDSYNIAAEGDPSAASVRVRNGATTVAGSTVNLVNYPGITINTSIAPPTLTSGYTAAPHKCRIQYTAGTPGVLKVWFDDVLIIPSLAVNLADYAAMNSEGKAWVGFGSRTGGVSENHDITSWFFTSTAPVFPLRVTGYTFNLATGQGQLNWTSAPGKNYRITASTTLASFPTVLATGIPSGGTETSSPFTFTPNTKAFFRVEELP